MMSVLENDGPAPSDEDIFLRKKILRGWAIAFLVFSFIGAMRVVLDIYVSKALAGTNWNPAIGALYLFAAGSLYFANACLLPDKPTIALLCGVGTTPTLIIPSFRPIPHSIFPIVMTAVTILVALYLLGYVLKGVSVARKSIRGSSAGAK
jgi:hypothetical protein